MTLRKEIPLERHKMREQPHLVRSALVVWQGLLGGPKTAFAFEDGLC